MTALMILGTLFTIVPANAILTPDHVPSAASGVPGLVQTATESGAESPVGVFLRPGVEDPYKPGWSHTLDTLRGTQGGEAQRDEIIRHYEDYAILASMSDSIGDFQFDLWVLAPISDIRIYVPSNFTFAYTSSGYGEATTSDKVYSIWTDITLSLIHI